MNRAVSTLVAGVKKLTHQWALLPMCVALAIAPGRASAQQRGAPAEPVPADLEQYVDRVLVEWQIPGLAIAVVRNDSTLVARGWGVRTLGGTHRVDENTVFDIASLAKSFTATAIGMLVDRGALHWDDPVRRHLPALVLPNEELTARATVRDFLSHRTGLDAVNMMWVLTAVDRDEVLRRMRHVPVRAPLRQSMIYSNIGYTVAGEAAAAAGRTTLEALLRDLVIKPLGLSSTTWTYEQAGNMPNLASPHATIGGRQQPIRRERQRQPIAAAAAVQSSVKDLTRWMRLHLNNGVLDGTRYVADSTMREMHSIQVPIATTPSMRAARMVQDTLVGYGLGWQAMDYRGHPLYWHSGNGDGQIAYMALLPKDRLGVVVLVNTWSAPFVHGALVNRILDTYLGYQPRDWAAEALARVPQMVSARDSAARAMIEMKSADPPPLPLSAYAGRYDNALFGPVWVRTTASGLTLQMGDGQTADLEYHGGDAFFVLWRDPFFREYYGTHVTFTRAGDSVSALSTRINRDEFVAQRGFDAAARSGALMRRPSWPASTMALVHASPSDPQRPREAAIALEDVRLVDGTGRETVAGQTIVIRDGRIAEIFPTRSRPAPAGTQILRLSGMFVMPGLIDAHVHVTSPFTTRAEQESVLALLFRSGVTTVRDMAGDVVALTALQRRAAQPRVPWPRIHYSALMAGPSFLATDSRTVPASHGVTPGPSPWLRAIVDTTNLSLAIDVAKWTGAAGIKLYAELPADLVARISAEAHRQQMKVWSHVAIIPARPGDAVRAGVDVISHADLLVAEGVAQMPTSFATFSSARQYDRVPPNDSSIVRLIRQMKAAGTMLEPTLLTTQRMAERARRSPGREAMRQVDRWTYEVTRLAHDMGVRLVAGTDLMGMPGRDSLALMHDELELMVRESGLTPLAAIRSATLHGAIALGIEADYGSIEVGKIADLVVLRADPVANIRNTRAIALIVKGGLRHSVASPAEP